MKVTRQGIAALTNEIFKNEIPKKGQHSPYVRGLILVLQSLNNPDFVQGVYDGASILNREKEEAA